MRTRVSAREQLPRTELALSGSARIFSAARGAFRDSAQKVGSFVRGEVPKMTAGTYKQVLPQILWEACLR